MIGVAWPAHLLNNCVHHDDDNIMFKIYQYLHIYTAHTENLKEFCEFVDIEYRAMVAVRAPRH